MGIRLLKAGEIECRVSLANEKGVSLLLYKDARVDQRILDETFGAFGWKRSHQCMDGNLYCTVEILDKESGEWIAKQDVGVAGYAEKEKSQASDSFKRACFNWGIGRELYTAPFIWIPASKAQLQKKGDRYYCNERFSISSIDYSSSREISALTVENGKGQEVFRWKKGKTEEESRTEGGRQGEPVAGSKDNGKLTRNQMDSLQSELERTGVGMEAVKERYQIEDPAGMGKELYHKVMQALAKTKSAEAA